MTTCEVSATTTANRHPIAVTPNGRWDISVERNLFDQFKVEPGSPVDIHTIDPSYCLPHYTYETAVQQLLSYRSRMDALQKVMYAERRHSLLIVLQGLDAGGKDGVVRHLLSSMNPAGCRAAAFRQPTKKEVEHDFLWRIHPHVPGKGEVVIFNRSHYEDVLVVRVHQLVPPHVWSKRYELINDFEKLLVAESNTTILKFFLHISKDEQLVRFRERLEDSTRRWKISEADYQERTYWDDYAKAFQDMLQKTSTRHAPWFLIPSNHKWFRDLAISQIVTRTLEELHMRVPETAVDIESIRRRHHAAELEAKAS
jgi:PPK2 family polyphosphate:nucleotide phosphotransferase